MYVPQAQMFELTKEELNIGGRNLRPQAGVVHIFIYNISGKGKLNEQRFNDPG